jgi:tetratricopeptide (TPR) repeat protein
MSLKIETMSPEQALEMLESRKHDDEVLALNEEACQLLMAGNFDEAREKLEKAIRLNPRYPMAKMNLGASYSLQGRWREAIPWLEEALDMDPNLEGATEALEQCRQNVQTSLEEIVDTSEDKSGQNITAPIETSSKIDLRESKKWWQFWK